MKSFFHYAAEAGVIPSNPAAALDSPRVHRAAPQAVDPGDVQLLNNHVVFHGRTAYEDAEGPGRDRLLLRLWLAPPNSRPLPDGFETLWGSIRGGAVRGGIAQSATVRA